MSETLSELWANYKIIVGDMAGCLGMVRPVFLATPLVYNRYFSSNWLTLMSIFCNTYPP